MPSPEFGWSDAAPASGSTPRSVSSATTVPHRRPPASTNGTCRPPRRVHVRWIGHAWESHRTFHCQWYIKYQIRNSRNDQPARCDEGFLHVDGDECRPLGNHVPVEPHVTADLDQPVLDVLRHCHWMRHCRTPPGCLN